MFKILINYSIILSFLLILPACGDKDMPDEFQQNQPADFKLTEITKGYGAVEDAYDSIDAEGLNDRLSDVIDADKGAFEVSAYGFSGQLDRVSKEPIAEMIRSDVAGIIERLDDRTARHMPKSEAVDAVYTESAATYANGFFRFLDKMDRAGVDVPDETIPILLNKVISYILDSIPYRLEWSEGEIQALSGKFKDEEQNLAAATQNLNLMMEANIDKKWLNDKVDELLEDIFAGYTNPKLISDIPYSDIEYEIDPEFQEDFIDIIKLISKLTIQTDYPMWVDENDKPLNYADIRSGTHTNIGLGNAVQGTHDLLMWLNKIIQTPETRELLYAAIQEVFNILDTEKFPELNNVLYTYINNVEKYFTKGGLIYNILPGYSESSETMHSRAELGETLREMALMLAQLFLRSDRPNAMIATKAGEDPVYVLDVFLKYLRNIGFDPDKIDVEKSIYDLIRHDIWGRDRLNPITNVSRTCAEEAESMMAQACSKNEDAPCTDEYEAFYDECVKRTPFPVSQLESLLFLTYATSFHGWADGGDTSEKDGEFISRSLHGHGEYVEQLTLNDSLFSMGFRIALGNGAFQNSLMPTDGNHIYRTRSYFTLDDVDGLHALAIDDPPSAENKDFRFFYDQNYGVLRMLAGSAVGDLGVPDGGNTDIEAGEKGLGNNEYNAYSPNGLDEGQLGAWTMGLLVRACFNGEGPYYYKDPNAEEVNIEGRVYKKYVRPNGRIYAYVSGDSYIYPVDNGDVADPDSAGQRDNRYKSQWQSDYYMSHFTESPASDAPIERYITIDNTLTGDETDAEFMPGDTVFVEVARPTQTAARRLTYNELVDETDARRACGSQEEAIYRNYQYVMTEKKMVLIIPMHMAMPSLGTDTNGVYFQIIETNGVAGIANMRKYRSNHVWAKKNQRGTSDIPGDYRAEVLFKSGEYLTNNGIDAAFIYSNVFGCGNATPSIVGHNLPSIYRLAFPLSQLTERGDYILGSREFEVGDDNWNNRNAVMPLLFSLMAALREYTPAYDPDGKPGIRSGMRNFLKQTAIIIKPLFYFNSDPNQYPQNSWIPRVYGDPYNEPESHFLKSSAEFYTEDESPLDALEVPVTGTVPKTYYGSWKEHLYYQPAVAATMLNILYDSDIYSPQKRCDGLLPLITRTNVISALLKLLLVPGLDTPPLEQILSSVKGTKGKVTQINETLPVTHGLVYPDWMFATGVEASKDANTDVYQEFEGARDEDIIFDEILDFLIGHDEVVDENNDSVILSEGYGLAYYPDNRCDPLTDDTCDPDTNDRTWQDFYDLIDTVSDLTCESSTYNLLPQLFDLMDKALAGDERYTSEEIYGLLYNLGKLFSYYGVDRGGEGMRWIYQGENPGPDNPNGRFDGLYNLLTKRLPALHKATIKEEAEVPDGVESYDLGEHYYAQLKVLQQMTQKDGLLEFLISTVNVPQDWEEIFYWLNRFLGGGEEPVTVISDPNSELWPTLEQLLWDMGKATGQANSDESLNSIYSKYGFQVN